MNSHECRDPYPLCLFFLQCALTVCVALPAHPDDLNTAALATT